VLEPLWRDGSQTIRQLTAAIYPRQSVSDYATVQKLLDRLAGC
jgi:predicted transcriptional regulator